MFDTQQDAFSRTKFNTSQDFLVHGSTRARQVIFQNHDASEVLTNVVRVSIGKSPQYEFEHKTGLQIDIPYLVRGRAPMGYSIVRPIPATISYVISDSLWLISDELFDEYGTGQTISEARKDYIYSLTHYYKILAERATEENKVTQIQLEELQQYLIKSE